MRGATKLLYSPITARRSRNQREASGKAKSCRPAQKLSVSSTEIEMILSDLGRDLTGLAKVGTLDCTIGRDREIAQLMSLLQL